MPGSLAYTIGSGTTPVSSKLVEKSNGEFVLFLWREKEKAGDDGEIDGEVINLRLAKHRNGPTGAVALWFEGEFARYRELERTTDPDQG